MPQETLYNALQVGEHSLIDYSFQVLNEVARLGATADPGNPQAYGGSHTGAALLYILRCGSADDLTKAQGLLTEHQILRHECCRSGNLDAEHYSDLWKHSYAHSSPEERNQILTSIGVDLTEGENIEDTVSAVQMHCRMQKVQNSMGSHISPTLASRQAEEDRPKKTSIIPDRMLPAFHYTMIVVALSAIFCISGIFSNFLYLRALLMTGRLDNIEDSSNFWIVFIIGGIMGVTTVWSWRYVKTKEEKYKSRNPNDSDFDAEPEYEDTE